MGGLGHTQAQRSRPWSDVDGTGDSKSITKPVSGADPVHISELRNPGHPPGLYPKTHTK